MAVDLHPDIVKAINRFARTPLGRKYGKWAKKNVGISGKKLQAKTVAGEFGGRSTRSGRGVVSSAGARGPAQFIPETRTSYIRQYGVDPWKNDLSAMKGMAIHHMGTGVAGYNPGMPTYTNYILGQKINPADIQALRMGGRGAGGSGAGGGSLRVAGRQRPGLRMSTEMTPGISMAAERQAARRELLMGGISMDSLLRYASQKRSLKDVPGTVKQNMEFTPGKPGKLRRDGPGADDVTKVLRGAVIRDGWKGSKAAGINVAKVRKISGKSGSSITSEKRGTVHTASGNVSDHFTGNKDSYAWDVSGGDMDRVARIIGRKLGRKYKGGYWLNVTKTINGRTFRFQLGWKVPDHYDHVHLGVDRVDTPG